MENETKFLVIKYARIAGVGDCIQKHQDVIHELGYCWFGKIGSAPTISCIKQKIGDGPFPIILYFQGNIHICECTGIAFDMPNKGCPRYYDYLIERGMIPSIFFKLSSINQLSSEEFSNCVSLSSGRKLSESVRSSMASLFYGMYLENAIPDSPKNVQKPKRIKQESRKEEKKEKRYDMNSCKYRKDGKCSNKYSTNYKYECDKPSNCTKQKPLIIE